MSATETPSKDAVPQQTTAQASASGQPPADVRDELIAHAPVGLAIVDEELCVHLANAALLRHSPGGSVVPPGTAAVLGRPLADVLPHLAPQLVPLCRRVLGTGNEERSVLSGSAPDDGPRAYEVHVRRTGGHATGTRFVTLAVEERTPATRREEPDRARLMQELASGLALAGSVDEVARVLAESAAPALSASVASVAIYDPLVRRLTMVRASEAAPNALTDRFPSWSLDDPLPARDVFATGRPVLLGSHEERDRRYPAIAAFPVPQQAWANLLLAVRGRPLGLISFGWDERRTFPADEVARMQVVADLSAGALERARLADDRGHIAETLQRALLPSALPRAPGWQLSTRYHPAGSAAQAGGDWYDGFRLSGSRLGLLIGDVAGHGVAAAALMGQVRALAGAEARSGDGPAAVLARLNRATCAMSVGGSEALVTCCYVQLDRRNSVLRVASAGHPPPFLRTPGPGLGPEADGATVEAMAIRPGPPLGVLDGAHYQEHRQLLPQGSTVLMFTDGLIERHGESLDEGLARLREYLRRGPEDVESLCDLLLHDLLGGEHANDDVALVAARNLP